MEGKTRDPVTKAKPFLKWAGGKSRSASALVRMAPSYSGTYWEPFMGSGAVFFELAPERAVLADANEELIVCFQAVASDPHAVMDFLDTMPNTREFYLDVRAQNPATLGFVERAARVVYLNKTGFRGLWRVNRQGGFNVPYGQYDRPLLQSRQPPSCFEGARDCRRDPCRLYGAAASGSSG